MTKQNDVKDTNVLKSSDELDEILFRVFSDGRVQGSHIVPANETMILNKAKQKILDWHNREVERIIGEDEKEDDPNCGWGHDFGATTRNEFRAEVRARAKGGE